MQGRVHPYEGHPYWLCAYVVRVMAELGCHTVIFTNAAGSLRSDFHVSLARLLSRVTNMICTFVLGDI